MHPVLVFTARYGPPIAQTIWVNRGDLLDAWERLARPVTDALAGTAVIDRVGPALVSVREGQTEVIGLLHRHTTKLDGLQAAIDQVWAGQQAIAGSLDLLTALSAVGLGVSVLSHAVLSFQLTALTRRLDRLAGEVRELRGMVQADYRGRLTAGLAMYKNGLDDPAGAGGHFADAATALTHSSACYAELLTEAVRSPTPAYPWEVARHLAVSALGLAAARLRTGHPAAAVRAIDDALGPLRGHARTVFGRTVAFDPARFLIPALAVHGLTLEAVAELYRQAALAGVVDEQPLSAAERFEALRGNLLSATDPLFFKGGKVRRLLADWTQATAAVEEVNRVQGVKLAIEAYHSPDRTYDALADQLIRQTEATVPPDGTVLAFFPPRG